MQCAHGILQWRKIIVMDDGFGDGGGRTTATAAKTTTTQPSNIKGQTYLIEGYTYLIWTV
jgi:hypothetical protein